MKGFITKKYCWLLVWILSTSSDMFSVTTIRICQKGVSLTHYIVSRKDLKSLYKGKEARVLVEETGSKETNKSVVRAMTRFVYNLIDSNKEKFIGKDDYYDSN